MVIRFWKLSLLGAVVLSFNLDMADGGFVTYSDRTTWQTDVGTSTILETFDSVASDIDFTGAPAVVGPLTLSSSGAGASQNGFGPEARVDVTPFGSSTPAGGVDSGSPFVNSFGLDVGESITISLATPSFAFGFDFLNYDVNGTGLSVLINGNVVASIPSGQGATGFIGLIDNMGGSFTSVTFLSNSNSNNGTFNGIDNVEFAGAVPEPTSLALLGMGVTGLCGYRWRRRHSSAA